MPTDYALIQQDNIREYGEGTRHLDFLQRLYADRTHFILELLQNAEDAHASQLTFVLYPDRLLVEHDGRPFNEQDVRGICGVDASTKTGELTSIGKFGIGFKSVYAYTLAPAVHSGCEHFRIRHYVRPESVDAPMDLPDDRTRFEFPFDREDVPSERAHSEIDRGLTKFDPVALLFLRDVRQVIVEKGSGSVTFTRLERGEESQDVELLVRQDRRVTNHQHWEVFRRTLDHIGYADQRVEIAFKRTGSAPEALVERIPHAPLVVYFPTDKPTGLGFLLQAPLRTTPARDNIAEQDPDNSRIIAEVGHLLIDTLDELRRKSRLGLDVLDVLPITPVDFPEGSLLRPLFDTLLEAVRARPLLPVAGPSGHAPATRLRLARGAGPRELLTPEQLGALAGAAGPLQWQPASLSRERNRELWDYLHDVVNVDELDAEWLVGQLDRKFLETAQDAWLVNLYRFLAQTPALWRRPRPPGNRPGPARALPLIRLNDSRHVAPFGADERPQAYLPGSGPSSFPTVRAEIAANAEARAFLEKLGLSEPDAVDEVLEYVVPKYRDGSDAIGTDQHDVDLAKIFRALQTATRQRRDALVETLRNTPFLLCRPAGGSDFSFRSPSAAYWSNEDLEHYFLPSPHGWFLHDRYRPYQQELNLLGVAEGVRVLTSPPNADGHVVIRAGWGDHSRGLHGFDPGLRIVGLDTALTHLDRRRSAYVWNRLLLPNASRLRGSVESSGRQDYSHSTSIETMSKALEAAVSHAWLPMRAGEFVEPAKLSLDDLPEDLEPSQALADALGMVSSAIVQVSAELNLSVATLRFLAENPDAAAELDQMRQRQERWEQSPTETPADAGLAHEGYAAVLEEAFDKPAEHEPEYEPLTSVGRVGAPTVRRQRTRDDIREAVADEPASQDRFRHIGRKVWDGKDPAVRQFFLEHYAGRCQICTAAFPKRDGTPYFEVIYLVSHTAAAWIGRPGNTLCLCPTCASKFLHGEVRCDDLLLQIRQWKASVEGGLGSSLQIELCGEHVTIDYTEKHLLDLQEMTRTDEVAVRE
ncbi:sacsin N-terminal ATP-binding-like domain-containing protein [Solwaraspora sp. WMMB335]|uniref:sacsin N-terminal ATP-binding-like domain-containing protein n=1 Tax=Solwaraspora sp. WMMB335 TaxID=3404118 RepID=UPI003B924283